MKILHLAAGSTKSGAFKGTYLLHQNLLKFGVKSLILNNSNINNIKGLKQTYSINSNFFENFKINFLYFFDRFPKILFFKRKNTSFSNNFFGLDITKSNYYNNADIIHFHWINRGFINLSLI